MKIQEYIKHSKDIYPSEDIKQSIYQKILSNTNRSDKNIKLGYGRFFYTKLTLGLSLVFILGFLLYGNNLNVVYNVDNFKVIKNNSLSNAVYADNVAKIISFDGSYNIYHGTGVFKNTEISNGDIVVIDTGSKISFDINLENYGEVYGPARFSIRKEGSNKYFIDLRDSEYFKFYKKNNGNDDIFDKIFGNSAETIISTSKYQIKGNNLNIVIAKKSNNESFIQNNGEAITIVDGNNKTQVPTNKIAKLNDEVGIINDGSGSIEKSIINKINNPNIIIIADNIESDPINNLEKTKLENNTYNGKILVKRSSIIKNSSGSNNKNDIDSGDIVIDKYIGQEKLDFMKDILNYKRTQNIFDSISSKMVLYDRTYMEDIYAIGESLARIHTKLGLSVNYSPNIYYIKYMSNNLRDYFSEYKDIPNDYIYSLNYISSMMDQINEKKAGDTLVNNYNVVPEIIPAVLKTTNSGNTSTGLNNISNDSGGVKAPSDIDSLNPRNI